MLAISHDMQLPPVFKAALDQTWNRSERSNNLQLQLMSPQQPWQPVA